MRFIFRSVNMETMGEYMPYWEETKQRSSDYSPGVLLCWARAFGYQLAFDEAEHLVWIKGIRPEEHYLAPVGNWNIEGWDEVLAARFGTTAEFVAVPEKLVDIWKKQLGSSVIVSDDAESDRSTWEYIHLVSELASLDGKKYIKKRNRINQFKKFNSYEYIKITPEVVPRIAKFQQEWCDSYKAFSDSTSIEQESDGIIKVILEHWEELPQMMGGAIEVMGHIVAYTIGEAAGNTLMIHFEKASLEYNAAYQIINQEFLIHEGSPYKYVDREEDMGDPGLRDAKMSYHPSSFLKKFRVRIKL